jgi:hypothetical protein
VTAADISNPTARYVLESKIIGLNVKRSISGSVDRGILNFVNTDTIIGPILKKMRQKNQGTYALNLGIQRFTVNAAKCVRTPYINNKTATIASPAIIAPSKSE